MDTALSRLLKRQLFLIVFYSFALFDCRVDQGNKAEQAQPNDGDDDRDVADHARHGPPVRRRGT